MPTTDANTSLTGLATCPLCGATLDPAHPNECPKCDWVPPAPAARPATVRDRFAVALSVIPGLGHFYKGHRLLGMMLLFGSLLAGFASVVAATASAGWGLLLLPFYWAGVMLHVYWLDDKAAGKPLDVPG